MGYLFPFAQVREERIPERQAFEAVNRIVSERLMDCDGVVAFSPYGSVPRGDHTERSDLDYMVVSTKDRHGEVQLVLDGLVMAAREHHVPLAVRHHSTVQAMSGNHPFGPSYRWTMRDLFDRDLVQKGILHQWYRCEDGSVRVEMFQKLLGNLQITARVSRLFHRHNLNADEMDVLLNEWLVGGYRPLHLHHRLARWILMYEQVKLEDDGKETVVKAFLADSRFEDLHETFLSLQELDKRYDVWLDRGQNETMRRSKYYRGVRRIISRVFTDAVTLYSKVVDALGRENRTWIVDQAA